MFLEGEGPIHKGEQANKLKQANNKATTVPSTVDQKVANLTWARTIPINSAHLDQVAVGLQIAKSTAVSSQFLFYLLFIFSYLPSSLFLGKQVEEWLSSYKHHTSKIKNVSTNNFHPVSKNLNKS